jgi:hypothetical protein
MFIDALEPANSVGSERDIGILASAMCAAISNRVISVFGTRAGVAVLHARHSA